MGYLIKIVGKDKETFFSGYNNEGGLRERDPSQEDISTIKPYSKKETAKNHIERINRHLKLYHYRSSDKCVIVEENTIFKKGYAFFINISYNVENRFMVSVVKQTVKDYKNRDLPRRKLYSSEKSAKKALVQELLILKEKKISELNSLKEGINKKILIVKKSMENKDSFTDKEVKVMFGIIEKENDDREELKDKEETLESVTKKINELMPQSVRFLTDL